MDGPDAVRADPIGQPMQHTSGPDAERWLPVLDHRRVRQGGLRSLACQLHPESPNGVVDEHHSSLRYQLN
jgi:hypothetical protein